MVSAVVRSRLVELLEPVVAATGGDLEDVNVRPAGRRSVVEVVVDRDGGVTLDDVADIARVVSEALDATDLLGDAPYTLEVGSRGVDRPLTLPRHWRRAVGRLVAVHLRDAPAVTGRIVAAGDTSVDLELAGEVRTIPLDDVTKAVVQVEFGAPSAGKDVDDDVDDDDDLGEEDA
ncbi:MAG: ribosome maturation factor RimP [Frankiaceae bacterium]|nr:ribosome maturation factor RimP [Frankiaceae bacterium]